jgi:oligopeptide transport system ATP-binding protein
MPEVILEAKDLVKHYPIKTGIMRRTTGHVKAVDGVSFELHKGETLGIVGESGCGKSTLGRLIMRLEEPTAGEVVFEGLEMQKASTGDMRKLRRDIQIVFQDPYTSLNPRMTVGDIIGEPFEIHSEVVPKGGRQASGCRSCSTWSVSTPSTSIAIPTSSPVANANASASPAGIALDPKVHRL